MKLDHSYTPTPLDKNFVQLLQVLSTTKSTRRTQLRIRSHPHAICLKCPEGAGQKGPPPANATGAADQKHEKPPQSHMALDSNPPPKTLVPLPNVA